MKLSVSLLLPVLFFCMAPLLRAQEVNTAAKHVSAWNTDDSAVIYLVKELNSCWDDFAPRLYGNRKIYFNSNRKNTAVYESALSNNEHIYFSQKSGDSAWLPPRKSYFLNNDDHTTLAGIQPEKNILFLYRTFGEGDLYFTTERNQRWQVPRKLKKPVNSDMQEQSITGKGDVLIISSERKGGKGQHDLYCSKRNETGKYTEFFPIDSINTEFDEVDVQLSSDGKKLFFSCDNPAGFGGYDLYWSELGDDGKWGKPKLFSLQLNSEFNDRWFFENGNQFYFSSDRPGGAGGEDIYTGYFIPKKRKIFLTPFVVEKSDTTFVELTIVRRMIIDRGDTTVVEIAFDKPVIFRKSDSASVAYARVKIPVFMTSDTTFAELTIEKKVKDDGKTIVTGTDRNSRLYQYIQDTTKFNPPEKDYYYARVQIGVYNISKEEFLQAYPSLKTWPIIIEKVKTSRGSTLNKFLVDQKFYTLQEAEVVRAEMINKHNIRDAFIAVYNSQDVRVAIYNCETRMFIMLVQGLKLERF